MANQNQIKNDAITRREDDFAQWYTDVCKKAELMDYSSVKGFIIYRPYGYAIWEEIQNYLNKRFKQTGHQNVYMPTVIPESLLQKEKDHVEGFAPECLVANIGGGQTLEDPLIIRPTSETLFTEHYAKIISSYRDLPKLYNQWCSVVRWEKTTRPFLRGAEFLWQEGHTMHETEEEARTETLRMLEIYDDLGRDLLAIPFVKGRKTEKEKFAGALETYSIEALMPDGKALLDVHGVGIVGPDGLDLAGHARVKGGVVVQDGLGGVLDSHDVVEASEDDGHVHNLDEGSGDVAFERVADAALLPVPVGVVHGRGLAFQELVDEVDVLRGDLPVAVGVGQRVGGLVPGGLPVDYGLDEADVFRIQIVVVVRVSINQIPGAAERFRVGVTLVVIVIPVVVHQ